jgi:hypothetical protein
MAKWKSPIFSDIRNKLGENVVFSMWKGRPYMREYVTPANPNTLGQQANRNHMAAIVLLYQTNIKTIAANVTAWNVEALSKLISGYNIFVQYGRSTLCTPVSLAAATLDINITDSQIPADRLSLMNVDAAGNPGNIANKRGLGHYVPGDFTIPPIATDVIYVVDTKVLAPGDLEADAMLYKGVGHWSVDEVTGAITDMVVT